MKKILLIMCMFMLSCIMAACGAEKKPDGVSEEMFKIGNQAIESSQQYIDGKISSGAGYQKLKDLYDQSRKILKETKSDYALDSIISSNIEDLMNSLYEDNSSQTVDYVEKLTYNLTPIDYESLKLSEILDGTWIFHHENGAILELTFDVDHFHGIYYDKDYNVRDDDFELYYRIDDEKKLIIETYEDNSGDETWATITNLSPKSFDYEIYTGVKGTAYKSE